jgi:TP901 family phage tail tape measure protein
MAAEVRIVISSSASGGGLQQTVKDLRDVDTAARAAPGGFSVLGAAAGAALGGIVVNAATAATGAVVGFVGSSISVASDFEGAVNNLAAVSGSALADAGFSFDDVSAKALELGQNTAFSASESIAAMTELVKGGIPVTEVMTDATDATLALAAATGTDLTNAAEIMSKQFGVWNETGVESGQIADLLTQAANASTVGVEDLAMGLAQAGGTAKTAGVEFEDLVQSMALIAPNFSSASDAGTSFKTFLSRLIPTTGPAKAAMADLGLTMTSTTRIAEFLSEQGIQPLGDDLDTLGNQFTEWATAQGWAVKEINKVWETFDQSVFYDAQGSFVGMEEAARLLQAATADLTEEERLLAFNTIFGADAIRAASAIANAGAEGFNAMGESMASAGTASETAAIQNQGFGFAMDSLKGSLETLQIVVGTMLLPVLTDLLTNVITPGVNTVTTMAQAFGGNAEAMAALSPQLQAIVLGIQQAIPVVQEIAAQIGANWQPILVAVGGIIAAVVIPALASFVIAVAPVVAAVVGAIAIGMALYNAWNTNFMGIQGIVQNVMAAVQSIIQSVMGIVLGFWNENGAAIMAFAQQTWGTVQEIIGTVVAIIAEIISRIFGGIADFLNEHGTTIQAILELAWNQIANTVEFVLNTIQGVLNTALAVLQGDWEGAMAGMQQILDGFRSYVEGAFDNIIEFLGSLGGRAASAGAAFIESIKDGVMGAIDDLISSAKSALQGLADILPGSEPKDPTSPLRGLAIRGRAIVGNLQEGIDSARLDLTAAVTPAVQQVGAVERAARSYNQQRSVNVTQNIYGGSGGFRQDAAIVRSLAGGI